MANTGTLHTISLCFIQRHLHIVYNAPFPFQIAFGWQPDRNRIRYIDKYDTGSDGMMEMWQPLII